MGVIRTTVVVGALALSIPVYAQGGRFGGDRSRPEQKSDSRSNDRGNDRGKARGNRGADPRATPRSESRASGRNEPRVERPVERPVVRRDDPRAGSRGEPRSEPRSEPRTDQRGRPADPWNRGNDRQDRSRYENRDRDRGAGQVYVRRAPDYGGRDYRVYDYDRGRREAVFIGGWFRIHGVSISIRSGMASRDRYDFRRGIYLDPFVLTRLELLPFDLELQLGDLPPWYERRMYGRTVLVIDMRTRMVVDVFDVDW